MQYNNNRRTFLKGKIINKTKLISILTILMILVNISIYVINEKNVDDRINLILDDNLDKLDIHYKTLLAHETEIADSFYKTIINKKGFLELFTKAKTIENRDVLRTQINELIKQEYKIMHDAGVLQFQLVLPNNESFLRLHQPEKFGDNLSKVRADLKHTNKTYEISRGLVQGRVIHGFRNVYPIFNKNGEYLGAMDISFPSEKLQNELTHISKIHAHFLIHKETFKYINIDDDDIKNKYTQSSEHYNYLMSLTRNHNREVCIVNNKKKLKHLNHDIVDKMDNGEKFAFYVRNDNLEIEVISFLPIKGFQTDKTTGWLVSYTKNQFVNDILETEGWINLFSFFIIIIFGAFIYHIIIAEMRIKKEHTLFDDVINTSEEMIFVTNFKTISFLNKKFKDYLRIDYVNEVKDITSYFVSMHGYLHNDLLDKNETFSELILKTPVEDRIVCLIDRTMNPKAFAISTVKSSYTTGDYLVTLTDITKLKERELAISNKAFYDGLTGVYNRNKFDELIGVELRRDIRYKNNLSLAIVDIDHFKKFNDTYGHLVGDEVLIMIATYLNEHVRNTDVFARWGGEEFVILFPETTSENAKVVCDKLREGIMALEHKTAGHVTASFGITQYKDKDELSSLFKRCDDALYQAKESGRNRVVIK